MLDMRSATESELLIALKTRLTFLNKHSLDIAMEIGRLRSVGKPQYRMFDYDVSQAEKIMDEIRAIVEELKSRQ